MCTTILAGNLATKDGSILLTRSADSNALKAQHFVIHPAKNYPAGSLYKTQDFKGATNFVWPRPSHAMRYTSAPNWQTQLHGAVGFNEAGLGVTGTESIFARDDFLAIDPYNKESGITEDDILEVILPECKTARQGVQLLGRIIETAGCGEGFGVAFGDSKECWYLETGTGHQWVATRLPADQYFASANQGRLRFYDPESDDWMGSPNVIDFAVEHGFYDKNSGKPFDFAAAYTRDDSRDRIYNDPRVWEIQRVLTPSLEQNPQEGRSFPVFVKPDHPITVQNMKDLMRNHFAGTEHDPYAPTLNGDEPWRPVSVFRTYESHVLQIRPWMPMPIGNVIYIAFGMADLSVYLPFYMGIQSVPEAFGKGTDKADNESAYWKFRKVQTLAMTDYENLAPVVKTKYQAFEDAVSARQADLEARVLPLLDSNPDHAIELLQQFSDEVLTSSLKLADSLLNELLTLRTASVQETVYFKNRKNKD